MKLHSRIKKAWRDKYPSSNGIKVTLTVTNDVWNKDLINLRLSFEQKIEDGTLDIDNHPDILVSGVDIINALTNLEKKVDQDDFTIVEMSDKVEYLEKT